MLNLYETIRESLNCNKFEVDGLLFVEYKCPVEDDSFALWSPEDYLVHVLSGRKTWRTPEGSWTIAEGQTVFIKKGATIIDQFFNDEFCMLGFFISEKFIKNTLKEYSGNYTIRPDLVDPKKIAIEVENDTILSAYFQSMATYFSKNECPTDDLLIIKMKELIINIITSPNNPALASYFNSLTSSNMPFLWQVMDANFSHNLSLNNYAELCYRSLSSFKRDFQKHYGVTPGKWLLKKRLEYAAILLRNHNLSITDVTFESGFEDLSHFSKKFKQLFGTSPKNFRKGITT